MNTETSAIAHLDESPFIPQNDVVVSDNPLDMANAPQEIKDAPFEVRKSLEQMKQELLNGLDAYLVQLKDQSTKLVETPDTDFTLKMQAVNTLQNLSLLQESQNLANFLVGRFIDTFEGKLNIKSVKIDTLRHIIRRHQIKGIHLKEIIAGMQKLKTENKVLYTKLNFLIHVICEFIIANKNTADKYELFVRIAFNIIDNALKFKMTPSLAENLYLFYTKNIESQASNTFLPVGTQIIHADTSAVAGNELVTNDSLVTE